ncbi:MAG: hypothetical protein Q8P41_21610 [Pseudomonadota bacterium]|nr:hypothetical protein [Pseudomonadota bacterium]
MPGHVPESYVEVEGGPLEGPNVRSQLRWWDETGAYGAGAPGDRAPQALLALLRVKARGYVRAARDPNTGDVTVPVFLHPGARWFGNVLSPALRARVTTIERDPTDPGDTFAQARGAPTLPIRVALADPDLARSLGDFRVPGLLMGVAPDDADVVIEGASTEHRRGPGPRLVVGTAPESVPWPGSPFVRLGGDLSRDAALMGLLFGLLHDLPLHDAVRQCGDALATLVCTPAANHGLRISHAADALADAAVNLHVIGLPFAAAEVDASALGRLRDHPLQFGRESGAAGPLSGVADRVRALSAPLPRMAAPAAGLEAYVAPASTAPPEPQPIRPPLQRIADVRIRRLERSPLAVGRTADAAAFVQPTDTLRRGARYELRLQIGAPAAGTLLTGDLPTLDALLPSLPEGERHTLDVVVHAQDFALASPPIQSITLGASGASEIARFVIVAPLAPRARLRVSVYRADALLQSFRVDARTHPDERVVKKGRAVSARLDYSRVPGFVSPAVPPRFACVSVNDAADGAHNVMVKSGADVGDARLSLAQAEAALAAFRDTVTTLTRDPSGPRYTVGVAPTLKRFATDLYGLAMQGWELGHALFDANPAGQLFLAAMRDRADLTVQFVRLSPRLGLPWSTIYDWDLPESAPTDICTGGTDAAPCGHTATDGVVCVRGFWGIRHRLEELVDTGLPWGTTVGPGPRLVAVDATKGGWGALDAANLPGGFSLVPPNAMLVDTLDGAPRPSVLAILGHHAVHTQGPKDLSFPRIEVGPDQRRLTRTALLKRCHTLPKWEDGARPLVLLMACETAVPLDPYPDFLAPLLTKGAIGVVATESVVYPDLVGFATRRLIERLAGGASLVDALRALRLELLQARNPLGFVFTAIGSADLHLA